MSRVGKMPVTVPQGVDVTIGAEAISVKGSLGTLVRPSNKLVTVKNEAGKLSFVPVNESAEADAMSGTMRALVANMVRRQQGLREEAQPRRRGLPRPGTRPEAQPADRFLSPRGEGHAGWH